MKPIYLDYQATTPMDPRVVSAMHPYWTRDFGNPHSEGHSFGWRARDAIEFARRRVADLIGADDDEIVFVSGATESCNLALRGIAASAASGRRKHIITLGTEHPAVLETALWLGDNGYDLEFLPVNADGLLDLHDLESALCEETLLVSIMLANNEIGVIQPLKDISSLCLNAGAFVHTDATQAAGRISINVDDLGVDLLSLSGHKIYGPNGVGILYVRNRPELRLKPIMSGGTQEHGLRPGTVPVPLAVGMGEACAILDDQMQEDTERIVEYGQRLLTELKKEVPNLVVFGSMEHRVPGSLNLGIPGVLGEELVQAVTTDIAISTGAACSTGSPKPSHVISALGIDPELAASGVRISLGRFTTNDEISTAIMSLRTAIDMLNGGI